jgi:hypothetical protein
VATTSKAMDKRMSQLDSAGLRGLATTLEGVLSVVG